MIAPQQAPMRGNSRFFSSSSFKFDEEMIRKIPSHRRSSKRLLDKLRKPSQTVIKWQTSTNVRLRLFGHIANYSQQPFPVACMYILITLNILTPFITFLHHVALPHEKNHDDEPTNKSTTHEIFDKILLANLVLVIFYGLRNFVLFLLGLGTVKQKGIMIALALDVSVWLAVCLVWLYIGLSIDHGENYWNDDNIWVLSAAGLLNAIQLNTFMLLNTVLDPLLTTKGRSNNSKNTKISVKLVERIIDESYITKKHKSILKDELNAVQWKKSETQQQHVVVNGNNDNGGNSSNSKTQQQQEQINTMSFFHFTNKAIAWADRWQIESGNEDQKELEKLMDRLDFVSILDLEEENFVEGAAKISSSSPELSDCVESVLSSSDTNSPVEALMLAGQYLITNQKLRSFGVTFLLFSIAFTDYLYYYLLGELVNIASDIASATDGEVTNSRSKEFTSKLIILTFTYLWNMSINFMIAELGSKLVSNATARLQREITKRVLYCGRDFEEKFQPGELANIFNASLAKLENIWNESWYGLIYPLSCLLVAIVFFCIVDVGYAMFVAVSLPILFGTKYLIGDRAADASENFTLSQGRLLGRYQNTGNMKKPAQIYQCQSYLMDRMEDRILETKHHSYLSLFWGNTLGSMFGLTGNILMLITSIVLLKALSTGKISTGEFFALVNFLDSIIGPLEQLGLMSGRVSYLSGAVFSIETLLQYEVDDDDDQPSSIEEDPSPLTLQQALTFENVGFRYSPTLPYVIEDVTTSISAGTYVACFGESGSGKSTLLSLVKGFNSCSSGRICMDGRDITSVSKNNLRSILGVVFQQTYVLDGTIRENITFGLQDVSMEDVEKAAKDAQILSFIESLPKKYETLIGLESRISLSGGQLQRICGLARALLRKPALLILDEATSALDTMAEQKVIETVLSLRDHGGMTTLSVSHHPNTAIKADNIIVLSKNGKIEQRGTYQELLEEGGTFGRIIEAGKG